MNNNNNDIYDKDNKDLFLIIIRNKYLFNKIFSYYKYKQLYNYDNLFSIKKILNFDNGIEIIRDKVKSSSYLLFYKQKLMSDQIISKIKLIYSNFVSDTQENHQFYNQLFKNYYGRFENPELAIPEIIKHANVFVFDIYSNIFNINIQDPKITTIINQIYKSNQIFTSYYQFKMFNYINNNNNIQITTLNKNQIKFSFKQLKTFVSVKQFIKMNNQIQPNNQISLSQFTVDQLQMDIDQVINKFENINKVLNGRLKLTIQMLQFGSIQDGQDVEDDFDSDSGTSNEIKSIFNSNDNDQILKSIGDKFELYKLKDFEKRSRRLINGLMLNDDVELIGMVFNNYSTVLYKALSPFLHEIISGIRSTKVLDFFYNNSFCQNIIFKDENIYWMDFNNIQLLQHYDQLMNSLGRKALVSDYHYEFYYQASESRGIDLLLHALNNPQLYKISNYESFIRKPLLTFKNSIINCFNTNNEQLIISLFKKLSSHNINLDFTTNFMGMDSIKKVDHLNYNEFGNRMLYWVLSNQSKFWLDSNKDNNKSTYIQVNLDQDTTVTFKFDTFHVVSILLASNMYSELLDLYQSTQCQLYNLMQIVYHPHHLKIGLFIHTLNRYRSLFNNNNNNNNSNHNGIKMDEYKAKYYNLLYSSMTNNTYFGNIHLYQVLDRDHSCIFKTGINDGIFTLDHIKLIAYSTLSGDQKHKDLLDIIKKNINITQSEFTENK